MIYPWQIVVVSILGVILLAGMISPKFAAWFVKTFRL